jgi:hypothetical protein
MDAASSPLSTTTWSAPAARRPRKRERGDALAGREVGARGGDHLAHALDAEHAGEVNRGRVTAPREPLRAMEAERAHADRDLAVDGRGIRQLPQDQVLRPAGFFDDVGAHLRLLS